MSDNPLIKVFNEHLDVAFKEKRDVSKKEYLDTAVKVGGVVLYDENSSFDECDEVVVALSEAFEKVSFKNINNSNFDAHQFELNYKNGDVILTGIESYLPRIDDDIKGSFIKSIKKAIEKSPQDQDYKDQQKVNEVLGQHIRNLNILRRS